MDEGWELWVCEGDRKILCAGRVSVDDAVIAARRGHDPISMLAERTKRGVLSGRVELQPPRPPSGNERSPADGL